MSIIEKCTHIVDSFNNAISKLLWGSTGIQVSLYTTPCGNPGCSNRIPLAVRKAKPRGTSCNCKNDAKRAGSGAGWRRKFGKFRGLKLCRVQNSLIDISSSSLSNLSNRLSKLKEVCSETKNGSRAEVEEILDEDSSKSDEIRVEDSPVNLVSDYVQTCTDESIEYSEKPKRKKQAIPLKYLKVINTGNIKKSFTKKKNCCKAGAGRLKLGLSDSVIPLKLASRELLAKASDSFTSVRNKIKIPKKKEIFEHPPGYKIPNKFSFKSSLGTQSRDYNKSKVSFECSAPRDRTADAEGRPAVETRSRGTCASSASGGSSSNLASFSNLLKTVGTVAKRIASSLSTSDFDSTLSCLSHLSTDLRNRLLKFECAETGRRTPGFFNVPKISIDKLTSRLNTNVFPGHFTREGKSAKENNASSEEDKATSESSSSEEFTVKSKREKYKDIQKISTSSEGSSSESDTDEEAIKTVNEKCPDKACKRTCLACTVQNSNISYKAGQRHQSEQKSKEKNKKIQIPSTNCEVESIFMSPVLIKKSYNAKLPNGFQTNLKPDHTQTLLPNKERERMEAKKMPKGSKVFVERQAKNFHANYVTKQLRADNKSRTYEASFDEDPTTDVESLCLRVEVSEESQRCPVGSMLRTAEEKIKAADARKSSEDIVADLTKSIMEANANDSNASVYSETFSHTSNKSSEEKDSKEITLEEVKPIEEAKLRRRISWTKYKEPPINPAAETNPKKKKTRMARFFDRILRYDKTSAGSRWKLRTLKNENELQPGDELKTKKKQIFGNKKSSLAEQKPAVNKKQGHINLPHDTNEKIAVETTAGPKAHASISTFDSEDLRSDEMFRSRRIMDSVEKMMLQVGKKKQNGGFLAVVRKPSQRYLPMARTRSTAQKNYSVPKIGSHLFRRSAVSVEKKKGRVKPEKLVNKRQDSLIRRISTVLFNNSRHSTTSDENDNDNPKIDDDKPTTNPERQLSSALKKDSSSERKRSVNFADINDSEHDTDERSKHYPNQPNNHDIDKKNTIEFNGPVHRLITPKHSMAVLKSTKDDDQNLRKETIETIANEKVPGALIKNVNDAKSEVTERSPQNISDASDATTSSSSTAPSEPTVARKKSLLGRLSTLFRRHSSTDSVPTENEDAKTEKKYKKNDYNSNESEKEKPSQKEHATPLIDKSSSNSFTRKTTSRTQEFKASSRKLSVDRKISSTLFRQRQNKIEMQKSSTKDTLKSITSKTPEVVEPLLNLKKSRSFDIEENPETEENEDIIPIKKVSRSVFKNSSDSSFNLIDNEEKESVKSIPTSILKRLSGFLVFKRSSSSSDIKENKISTLSIRNRHSKPSTSSADDRRVTKNGKKLAPGKKISKKLFRRAKVKSREVSTVSSQQPKDKLESVDLAESLIDAHWDMIERRLGLMRKVMMVDKTTNVCPRSRIRGSIAGLLKESSDDKITIPTSIYEGNSTITETDEEDDESCPPLMLGSDVEQLSKRVDVQYAKMPYFQNTHQTKASKRKKLKGKVENLRCNSSKACNRAQLSQNSYNIKYVTPFENSANETRVHDRCDKRKTSITDKYGTRDTESKEKNNILRALSKFDDIFCPNCPKNDLRTLVQKLSKSKIDALIHYTKTNNNASADTQTNPRGGLMPYDASKPHTRRTPKLNEETDSVEDIKTTIVHRLASLIQHYHGVRTTRACQTPGRKDADRTMLSIRRRCNPGNSRIPKRDSSVISQESSYSSPTFSDASIL